jgi:hypothetical protein
VPTVRARAERTTAETRGEVAGRAIRTDISRRGVQANPDGNLTRGERRPSEIAQQDNPARCSCAIPT